MRGINDTYLSVNEKVTTEERDMIQEKNSIYITNNHVIRISALSWRKVYSPTRSIEVPLTVIMPVLRL